MVACPVKPFLSIVWNILPFFDCSTELSVPPRRHSTEAEGDHVEGLQKRYLWSPCSHQCCCTRTGHPWNWPGGAVFSSQGILLFPIVYSCHLGVDSSLSSWMWSMHCRWDQVPVCISVFPCGHFCGTVVKHVSWYTTADLKHWENVMMPSISMKQYITRNVAVQHCTKCFLVHL